MAGKAPAALAASAEALAGQSSLAGDSEDPGASEEDEKPPAKPPASKRKEPEASEEEEEPTKNAGYTSDDMADLNAEDLGMKKLLGMCGVKNSLAHEIKLRGEGKSEHQAALEFDKYFQSTPPPPDGVRRQGEPRAKKAGLIPIGIFFAPPPPGE